MTQQQQSNLPTVVRSILPRVDTLVRQGPVSEAALAKVEALGIGLIAAQYGESPRWPHQKLAKFLADQEWKARMGDLRKQAREIGAQAAAAAMEQQVTLMLEQQAWQQREHQRQQEMTFTAELSNRQIKDLREHEVGQRLREARGLAEIAREFGTAQAESAPGTDAETLLARIDTVLGGIERDAGLSDEERHRRTRAVQNLGSALRREK